MAKGSPWKYGIPAAALLAGCLTGLEVIPIEYTGSAPPAIDRQGGYASDVRAIAHVLAADLKLPPTAAVVIVYPSLGEYESGFVTELGAPPDRVSVKTQALAVANCPHKKVLANGDRLSALPWHVRVRTLAHEMTHLAQFALAGWSCRPPHAWLTEGFAHRAAYQVLEKLWLDTFAAGRAASMASVRLKSGGGLPALSRLVSPPDWDATVRNPDVAEAIYGRSFLAADYLIERKGAAAAVEYFRLFGRENSRDKNFRAAFGQDPARFEADFDAYLEKVLM